MPAAFDRCDRAGGRIRTITRGPKKGHLVCFMPGGGSTLGEKRRDLSTDSHGSGRFTKKDMSRGYMVL